MEQNRIFGLILGQLAILKKNWADYEQLLRSVFSCFQGQFFFFFKLSSVRTKKLHDIMISLLNFFLIFFKHFFGKNRLNIHNQLCIALLDIPLHNFFIMTLVITLSFYKIESSYINELIKYDHIVWPYFHTSRPLKTKNLFPLKTPLSYQQSSCNNL